MEKEMSFLAVNFPQRDLLDFWILILVFRCASACLLILNLSSFCPFLHTFYFLFIPLLIFWFITHTQHRLVSFPISKPGSYLVKSLKFLTFNMNSMYSKKHDIFLLICVVKVQRYWKDETVLVHTENPTNPYILIPFHIHVHLDL